MKNTLPINGEKELALVNSDFRSADFFGQTSVLVDKPSLTKDIGCRVL